MMSDKLKRLLAGISEMLPFLANGREYPEYEGFARDAANLRDWNARGNDMRNALKKEINQGCSH